VTREIECQAQLENKSIILIVVLSCTPNKSYKNKKIQKLPVVN
jgi:hypothetical protein